MYLNFTVGNAFVYSHNGMAQKRVGLAKKLEEKKATKCRNNSKM